MAYVAPTVDASGLHLPTFTEILDDMVAQMRVIFGTDIYLENDSTDYQMLAIFARKVYDTLMSVQLAYNNRSPVSAVGVGLDSIVKLNGLARQTPSYSICSVTVTGTAALVITNGVVRDINGYKWDLPASVTIGVGGTVEVTATCQTVGAITATAHQINIIDTPTLGWTSVDNTSAATAGQAVEADSALRSRQSVSTAYPSQTVLAGTYAGIAALTDVDRFVIFENDTHSAATDPNGLGLPQHSITCVVEGGDDTDVAEAIFNNRGIGATTNGDVEVWLTDPVYSAMTLIKFYRPVYVDIDVEFTITPMTGYTTATEDSIKEAVADYLNSLDIYQPVTISGLEGAALSIMTNLARPTFSITQTRAAEHGGALGTIDLVLDYIEVSQGSVDYITII